MNLPLFVISLINLSCCCIVTTACVFKLIYFPIVRESYIEEELEKEKAYLKAKSQEIYDLWLKIRAEQVKTGKVNTFYKLKVYQGPDDMDVLYNLQKQNDEIKLEPETLKRK